MMALNPNATTTSSQGYHLRIALASLRGTGPLEQVIDHVLEHGCVELVDDLLAVALRENQLGVPQDREMARDRRPSGRKFLGDLPGGLRALPEELEDVATSRVGQCLERGLHGRIIS